MTGMSLDMTASHTGPGAHTLGHDDVRRANPLGAYITTLGALILAVSMFMPWVGIGGGDNAQRLVSGYESDSLIPYMGLLGLGFSAALLYATKRADRRQHRGLSLASFAVGLASLLWIILYFINPIETVKFAGAGGEANANVSTAWALWIGLIGALLWTIGSFLLAKEPEGDVEHDTVHRTATVTAPATVERHVETGTARTVGVAHDVEHGRTTDVHRTGSAAPLGDDAGATPARRTSDNPSAY